MKILTTPFLQHLNSRDFAKTRFIAHLKSMGTSTIMSAAWIALSACQSTQAPAPALAPPITYMQDRFDGPAGSALHDFVNATNACQREISQFDQYRTAAVIPTCSLVIKCLASKGYVSKPYGKFDQEELKLGISCVAQ